MARIDILREHPLSKPQALKLMRAFAEEFAGQYGATYAFDGDHMTFERGAAHGTADLLPGAIHIQGELGFLLSPLKGTMERHIHSFLDDVIAKENAKQGKNALPLPKDPLASAVKKAVAKKAASKKTVAKVAPKKSAKTRQA